MRSDGTFASVAWAALAAAFVVFTSQGMPAVVASHFGAAGAADGFMPRRTYVGLMVAVAAGLPLLLTLVNERVFRSARVRLNLPHREHWLAPERRDETVAFLCRHSARFARLLTVFLCYVHWLVVRAHDASPPQLSSPLFIAGLLAFAALAIAWLVAMLGRFRKVPPSTA